MKDNNQTMSEILGIFSEEEFLDFLTDMYELVDLYNVELGVKDWLADKVGKDNANNVRLARTAYCLSRFSHKHLTKLKQISRINPGWWQRLEQEKKG
jgi:hypothetical protein